MLMTSLYKDYALKPGHYVKVLGKDILHSSESDSTHETATLFLYNSIKSATLSLLTMILKPRSLNCY